MVPGHESHTVQFYRDDAFLCGKLSEFVSEGLTLGEPVLVIATVAHIEELRARLGKMGVDAELGGQLRFADAAETLAYVLVDGLPVRERLLERLAGALPANGRARVFGEMVELLVRDGKREAAAIMEGMGNDLARNHAVSLFCSYRLDHFVDESGSECFRQICDLHGQARPSERYAGLTGDAATLREVALLEQRSLALGRLQLLVDSIHDYAIFMLDPAGHVTSWNLGAQQLKGYKADEIIGRHFSVFYPDDDGQCERALRAASDTGRFEAEGWRVRKDGTRFWANAVITAVRDGNQRLTGFAKITRDLTERRRGEEERAALIAEKEASRAKDEFLAMLGHELRNPLAPIVTALQLMKLRGDLRSSHEQVVIERQVQHMVRLIDDLLDVSRISERKIELKRESCELAQVIAQAVELAGPLIAERRHRLSVDAAPGLRLSADPVRLTQVVANLLSNAAKYTGAEGHIEVAAWRDADELVLQVKDNGAGIHGELLSKVFDLFVQGPRSSDRAEGGLGVGLTLVQTLVRMHGGTVVAHSDGPGRGSAFVVRLPADVSAAACDEPEPPVKAHRKRVLLVDDNQDAATLLAELLGAMGHEVRVAFDGPEALASLDEFAPEVAVLDIGLPGMDGYQLAMHMRERLGGCRLIALTGYGRDNDRQRSQEAGFQAHLVKPVEPDELLALIEGA